MASPLPLYPQRHRHAANGRFGVGGRHALGIHGPTGGDGFFAVRQGLEDAVVGDCGGGHIQQPGPRHAHANRVGAQARFFCLPGRHDGRCIAHHHPQHACRRDLLAPVSRRAEMISFARRHDGDAMFMRQPHGVLATHAGDLLACSVGAVVEQACAGFVDHAAFRGGSHIAALHLFHIIRQQLHAVRIHTAQIGGDHDSATTWAVGLGKAAASSSPAAQAVRSSAEMTGMRIHQHNVPRARSRLGRPGRVLSSFGDLRVKKPFPHGVPPGPRLSTGEIITRAIWDLRLRRRLGLRPTPEQLPACRCQSSSFAG